MGRPRKDGTASGPRLKAIADRKKALLTEIAELDNQLSAAVDGQVNEVLEVLRPVIRELMLAAPNEGFKKTKIPDGLKQALAEFLAN